MVRIFNIMSYKQPKNALYSNIRLMVRLYADHITAYITSIQFDCKVLHSSRSRQSIRFQYCLFAEILRLLTVPVSIGRYNKLPELDYPHYSNCRKYLLDCMQCTVVVD